MKIIVVASNLFFLHRIQSAATPHNHEVLYADSIERFDSEYSPDSTALVLIDLEGDVSVWTAIIASVVSQGDGRPRVIAYGPHSDEDARKLARETGCDGVLSKGEFSRDLAKMIASQGASVAAA